ncbi:glycoside hydrolase family 9 protein [Mucilaginibacter sp. KACC 22063]|uniref:glycoside hydrolase family 9 protein n=1 Tax=Mucilaginibacter sp. KACC 22063 TaxID=3025666 RepID=UPI002365EF47|nr:glycoside hydrolase family 9 protein [Mucilaginibacter sp. KACC 22063]WDF55659.1 glycoside hydrolase family 9 protein [Mucilaginibacter sp. KACC 22063]
MKYYKILFTLIFACLSFISKATTEIFINQVAFDSSLPKIAVVSVDGKLNLKTIFRMIDASGKTVTTGVLSGPYEVPDWQTGKFYYQADFSQVVTTGKYKLQITINNTQTTSDAFIITDNALAKLTVPSIVHYYNKQRATTPAELKSDKAIKLFGSDTRVDMHGGWCDASGDVSKYFSHLAYANFVSPQQIPLVTWSLANAAERLPISITGQRVKDSLRREALFGADYMMRALSKDGYFRMIVFSYFNKDPNARRVVGLLANSVTTADYQCAFREGGGMAIAALARVSRWKQHGEYTSAQYLNAAKLAFDHLSLYNTKYDDDGKENIIDDYCALMAAAELWISTGQQLYQNEARKRAHNLEKRLTPEGYFIADDGNRPFWHAADAGLPVVALCRYLAKETNAPNRKTAINVISKALDYNLRVTNNVSNPFGYARQTFRINVQVKDGFFIPHENETGWWWQGENARLASLATAALEGGKLLYTTDHNTARRDSLKAYASQQLSWILGCNPYAMCFMYGFGRNNVPYMHSNFGHGSERGGISNGITGKDGNPDGSGIDFKKEANGNEWRWTEQWLPHAAWFLNAVTALTAN